MPQTTEDLTNPRQLLRELHKILAGTKGWEEKDRKKLSRWVKSTTIYINSDEIFIRLRCEIGIGFSKLFPVYTEDKANFNSNTGTHPYAGQFFGSQIWLPYRDKLLPFLSEWILEIKKTKAKDNRDEIAFEKITAFLSTIVEHKKNLYSINRNNSYWLPDELLVDELVGKYWFLPKVRVEGSTQSKLILPIERVLQNIVPMKDAESLNELIKKAVAHLPSLENSNYDSRQSAYETLKKSLNRLGKGKNITIDQLQQLREIPFSLIILRENWASKEEEQKTLIIKNIAASFYLSDMSNKEFDRFNIRWRKLLDKQYQVIKESLDGIFETSIVLAYLLSKIILDLQKYYPDAGNRLVNLINRPKLSQDLLSRLN